MLKINKEEKRYLARRFQNEKFVRTMMQDSHRGHYYCVERPAVVQALNYFRSKNVVEEHPPRKKNNSNKQQGKKSYNNYRQNNDGWRNDR